MIYSFNGKPQALLMNFAYAYGSPLNENDRYRLNQQLASVLRPYSERQAAVGILLWTREMAEYTY